MKKIILLIILLYSFVAIAQWYYGTGEATNLENNIGYQKNTQKIKAGVTVDPTSSAQSGGAGSLLLRTNGDAYLKKDAGNTTNWKKIIDTSIAGNLLGSSPISITGGTGVLNGTATVTMTQSSASSDGWLSSSDWSLFYDKQDSLSFFSATGTAGRLSVSGAGTVVGGSLTFDVDSDLLPDPLSGDVGKVLTAIGASQTAWQTMSVVGADLNGTSPISIAGGTGAVLNTATVTITQAGSGSAGYLSSTDWNTFNNKQNIISTGTLTSANAPLSISGGGYVVGSNTTVSLPRSSESQDGYLSSADHVIHNNNKLISILYPEKMSAAYVVAGNNATFDNGGSLQGTATITSSTSDLLIGTSAIKYVASGDQHNDWFVVGQLTPNEGIKGSTIAFEFQYKATVTGMQFKVKVNGGALDGNIVSMDIPAASSTTPSQMLFNVPSDATSLEYGFFNTSTVAITALFDRISISADPFGKANLNVLDYVHASNYSSTDGSSRLKFTNVTSKNAGLLTYDNSGTYTKITAIKPCQVNGNFTGYASSTTTWYDEIHLFNSAGTLIKQWSGVYPSSLQNRPLPFNYTMTTGDYLVVYINTAQFADDIYTHFTVNAIAESPAILTDGQERMETWSLSQIASSLTDRSGDVEFDLSTVTIEKNGVTTASTTFTGNTSGLLYGQDDSGNTRTKLIAARDCKVVIEFQHDSSQATSPLPYIRKNGTIYTYGDQESTTGYAQQVVTTISLVQGDYLTFGNAVGLPNDGNPVRLHVTAWDSKPYTTVAVPASKVNDFSARIANNGTATITSQGPYSFIQSVSRTAQGVVAITFVPGFFTQIPSIKADTENGSGNIITLSSVATSGLNIYCSSRTAGTGVDENLSISVSRQASDAQLPGAYVGNVSIELEAIITKIGRTSLTASTTIAVPIDSVSGDTFTSPSSNQFSLPVGGYEVTWYLQFYYPSSTSTSQIDNYLYNVTAASVITPYGIGQASRTVAANDAYYTSAGSVKFNLSVASTFELRVTTSTFSSNAPSISDTYTNAPGVIIKIRKLY
jgi:hypothetical protein